MSRTWQRPHASSHGLWIVPVGSPSLCLICSAAKQMPAGGLSCTIDPLRITVTRVCMTYQGEPGLQELWGTPAD